MILYRLRCDGDHVFEAWFRDSASYDTLAAAREVVCPYCASTKVAKAPMAPRLMKSRGEPEMAPAQASPAQTSPAQPQDAALPVASTPPGRKAASVPDPGAGDQRAEAARRIHAALATLRDYVENNADYVGDDFAEEARAIHYGEAEERPIYGESTEEEAAALADEGVKFARIPWPSKRKLS
jgi:hypothetical protein